MKKDIVIIGGGPGGYTAAEMAVKSGYSALVVEAESIGGACLNRGCIPTKTLYKEAELVERMIDSLEHGVSPDGFQINMDMMKTRKNTVIEKLRDVMVKNMESNNIPVIKGTGRIKDKNHVVVTNKNAEELEVEAKYIIIATGSRPDKPEIPGINLDGVITCEHMLDLDREVNDVLIVGGGVIGVEMAAILNTFGKSVKIVETQKDILNNIDDDIRDRLYDYAARKKIQIYTNSRMKKIAKDRHKLCVTISSESGDANINVDTVMISAGRVPVLDNLNLDEIGIEYDTKNGIRVDETLKTNIDNIYAIGDVVGRMMLAHIAAEEGRKAIRNIIGQRDVMQYEKVPYCIYTLPEVAFIGITEKQAREKGINYKVGYGSFMGCGRALAMGETDGFVKIICNENDTIIGVHIIGPHASDVIHEGALAVSKELKVDDIINCLHAHPTLSECFYEAAYSMKG